MQDMLANAFAILVLLMLPATPVGLLLIFLGWRGQRVRVTTQCASCQHAIPEAPAVESATRFCPSCGAPAIVAAPERVHRRRNRPLLISGVIVTALSCAAIGLAIAALLPCATSGLAFAALVYGLLTDAASPATPAAALASTPAAISPAISLTAEKPAEVMVAYTKAQWDGDAQTMLACFAITDPSDARAIQTGVAYRAARFSFRKERDQRFTTEEGKQRQREVIDELLARWAAATFKGDAATGTLYPAPGVVQADGLVPMQLVHTPAGWRIDSDAVLRQNLLGLSGSLSIDQEKADGLNAIAVKIRNGEYALPEEAEGARRVVEADAVANDMKRIAQAIGKEKPTEAPATKEFMAACRNSSAENVAELIQRGANVNAVTSGWTPLITAAAYNPRPEVIEALLKAGADVQARADKNMTPLLFAAERNPNPKVLAALLKGGAEVEARDAEGKTPLIKAMGTKPTGQMAAILIDAGADVNAADNTGLTAMMVAGFSASPQDLLQVMETLAKAGANVNAKNQSGWRPLMYAAKTSRTPEPVAVLLKAGAEVDARDNFSCTALMHTAAHNANSAVLASLIHAGASVNATGKDGWTPLMFAAMLNRNPDVIAELLKAGADINTKDTKGMTALDHARERKNTSAESALIKAGATEGAATTSPAIMIGKGAQAGAKQ